MLLPIAYLKRVRRRYYFWKERRYTGEYELSVLPQLISKTRSAVDVGGNVGSYTYQLSRLARRVHTFEPNPIYVAGLKALKLANVTVEQVALSDRDGFAELRIPRAASGAEEQGMASIEAQAVAPTAAARTLRVPTRRLDDYRLDDVGLVKIDVEGHEEAVIAGAMETIRRCRPHLIVEIEERLNPGALERILATLGALGYAAHFYQDGRPVPVAQFDAARHQPAGLVFDKTRHVRRSFPWINNFVFAPGP